MTGEGLSEDREHAIRRSHLEHRCAHHPAPICTYDRTSWPCDVHVLLGALDGARAACAGPAGMRLSDPAKGGYAVARELE